MDDLLIRVLTRLIRIHDELGERCFEHAANRALLAIALAANAEATRLTGGTGETVEKPAVIPFPRTAAPTKVDG